MAMTWIVIGFVINIIMCIVFLCKNIRKQQKAWLVLFFMALPLLGFIIYGISYYVWNSKTTGFDRDYFVHRNSLDRVHLRPEMDDELNVIPIEDAMAFGENIEKRRLLLNQLKKSVHGNYKSLLAASGDEDSESAHYIASAKMEVYNDLYENIKVSTEALKANPSDVEAIRELLHSYMILIDSGILSISEQNIYRDRYCNLFSKIEMDELYDATNYISYLAELGKYEEAISAFTALDNQYKTEQIYFKLLEIYYSQGKQELFYHLLEELCASDVVLSSNGIGIVRFWLSKGRS